MWFEYIFTLALVLPQLAFICCCVYLVATQKQNKLELDPASEEVAKEFAELRDQLFEMIGGSGDLLGIKTTVDQIVTIVLPRYLKRRRDILERLAVVVKIEAGLSAADRDHQRFEVLQQLEAIPEEISEVLRSLRVRLRWTIQDVAAFQAGLPNQSAEIRRDQRELNSCLETMQHSVRDPRLLTELEDGVFREFARDQVAEEPPRLDRDDTIAPDVKVH